MTATSKQEMCPFCPLMGIEEEQYLPVGNDFFGEPAMIGGIPSCSACAWIAEHNGTEKELVEDLQARQEVRNGSESRAD